MPHVIPPGPIRPMPGGQLRPLAHQLHPVRCLDALPSTELTLIFAGAPPRPSPYIGVFHLITVMIGAGVLSLPSSFALLGWALGPVLLLIFGSATVW